jgi:hypothetical protein
MGTSNQRNQTVAQWLAMFGYTYNANDPFQADYNSLAVSACATGIMGCGPQQGGFGNLMEACLRARAVLYYKSTPGDCGTATPLVDPGASDAAVAGQVGGIVGSIIGAAIPGLGTIIGLIEEAIEHHAQAVQTEETTLCSVSTQATAGIKAIDNAVATGAVTPTQGVQAMAQLVQTMNQGLQTILITPTDAAAYYISVMNAHLSFASDYYPTIAPTGIAAAGVTIKNALSFLTGGSGLLIILAVLVVAVIILFARNRR